MKHNVLTVYPDGHTEISEKEFEEIPVEIAQLPSLDERVAAVEAVLLNIL